jgi:hypothetical protein
MPKYKPLFLKKGLLRYECNKFASQGIAILGAISSMCLQK